MCFAMASIFQSSAVDFLVAADRAGFALAAAE
jgi:hypothetical protein